MSNKNSATHINTNIRISRTPPINNRGNLNSRGSLHSRGSSRGGIRNRNNAEMVEKPKRKKYSRPSTAPVWRIKNEQEEKLALKKKLQEMYQAKNR